MTPTATVNSAPKSSPKSLAPIVRIFPPAIQRFDRDRDGKLSVAELAEAIATLRQK
jgi:hypothetical protein